MPSVSDGVELSVKKISVVMATYNGESYLERQLESVIGQTCTPHELIIVDDGSTDRTLEILKRYSDKYNWISIFTNLSNLGVNAAFSRALAESVGDLVFVSDQDDVWDQNKIEIFLKSWRGESLLFSDARVIDDEDGLLYESEFQFHNCLVVEGADPWYYFHYNCVSGHNMMLRKDLIAKALPVPDGIIFDQWFALVGSLTGELRCEKTPLCSHRIHKANAVNNPKIRKEVKRKKRHGSKCARVNERNKRYLSYLGRLSEISQLDKEFDVVVGALFSHYRYPEVKYFNFKLFRILLKHNRRLYRKDTCWKRFKIIYNHCLGERMLRCYI